MEDAEALRRYLGAEQWSVYGQSFGGFIITSYLSRYPEVVEQAYLTGGLPALHAPLDDVYRTTFQKLRYRHEMFYREFPWAERRIREIAHHLDNSHELLPTGSASARGVSALSGLTWGEVQDSIPWHICLKSLSTQYAGETASTRLPRPGRRGRQFRSRPLYAAIHESIYGGVGGQSITGWAAHRVREEIAGFEENADPQGEAPYYLTGNTSSPGSLRKTQRCGCSRHLRKSWRGERGRRPHTAKAVYSKRRRQPLRQCTSMMFSCLSNTRWKLQRSIEISALTSPTSSSTMVFVGKVPIFAELHAKIRDH